LARGSVGPIFGAVKHSFLLLIAATPLFGCHHDRDAKGPMERAGQHIDNAAEKTGTALEKAAHKTDEAAHHAVQATGEAFEKAGNKLKGAPSATPSQPPSKTEK